MEEDIYGDLGSGFSSFLNISADGGNMTEEELQKNHRKNGHV